MLKNHSLILIVLLAIAACETGGKGYDTATVECSYDAPCPTYTSEFCTPGDLATAMLPHGALVTNVNAHLATGYEPWSEWVQTSEGLTYTCPDELAGGQGSVIIFMYETE